MTFRYRYLGEAPMCFVTIQKNAFPGGFVETEVPANHPLLELVLPERQVKVVKPVVVELPDDEDEELDDEDTKDIDA